MSIRLDKYLSEMGIATRSETKALVRAGRVTVDGAPAKKSDMKVDPDAAVVALDGQVIAYASFEYFMLNKPAGVVSATADDGHDTVIDLIPEPHRKDLFPVGRLDKDTVGLLLITNNGQLAHRLLAPGHHVDKVYFARLDHGVSAEDISAFAAGIDIGDEDLTLPAELALAADNPAEVLVTLREGRYHQVKRMFQALGNEVVYLKRLSMGALTLDPALAEGESRPLTKAELACLPL